MKQQEKVRAILNRHYDYPSQKLAFKDCLDDFTEMLISTEQEARAAAFKDAFAIECADCASGDEPIHDAQVRWFYHGEGRKQVGCSASKLRLEAAVTNPKHDDGPTNET